MVEKAINTIRIIAGPGSNRRKELVAISIKRNDVLESFMGQKDEQLAGSSDLQSTFSEKKMATETVEALLFLNGIYQLIVKQKV